MYFTVLYQTAWIRQHLVVLNVLRLQLALNIVLTRFMLAHYLCRI